MKVHVKEMTADKCTLLVEGTTPAFLNALRRTLIADVPKMAIDDVTLYDNTSALFDEMVAHRMGLIPIPTDLALFNFRKDCTCNGEGCANCTILYTLSKEGPGTVYSGDLTPADARFKIRDEKIPIVKLLEGQRVMMEAAAILGTTGDHAKWTPVMGAGYREVPRVEIKPQPTVPSDVLAQLERTAPPGALSFEDGKMRVLDEVKAHDFFRSAKKNHKLDMVKLSTEPTNFIFFFETDGALAPKDALIRAIHVLMEKLKHVSEEVPKLKLEEAPEA
ncbi:MAG: DNA-directed RNA polymerase subunit D [Thermoplasmatota archaeon]